MNSKICRSVTLLVIFLLLISSATVGLNGDGELLLKFKYSVLSDPKAVLSDWNLYDDTPCSWNGVVCMGFPEAAAAFNGSPPANFNVEVSMASRVISLVLPDSQLLGPVPAELGLVQHLRHLDLSGNMLNGTLPPALFNASELRVLSLANNAIFDELTSSSLPAKKGILCFFFFIVWFAEEETAEGRAEGRGRREGARQSLAVTLSPR